MRRISILAVLIVMLVPLVVSAGDPLDTNDGPKYIMISGTVEDDCALMDKWPECVPCRTACWYAIMADAWTNGTWDWDW